jgi:hypothetical protein
MPIQVLALELELEDWQPLSQYTSLCSDPCRTGTMWL